MLPHTSRRIMHIAVASAAALALTACAPRTPPEPIDLASAKTIGVNSFCGNEVQREANAWLRVGLDDTSRLAVPEWGLDSRIVESLRSGLPANAALIPVALDPAKVAAAVWQRPGRQQASAWRDLFSGTHPSADLYIAIFPRNPGVYWVGEQAVVNSFGSSDPMSGFGIFTRAGWRTTHEACGAFVYDARKGKIVGRLGSAELGEIKKELVEDAWKDYTSAQLDGVRELLQPMASRAGAMIAEQLIARSNLAPAAAK